jgi:hypothetical protein
VRRIRLRQIVVAIGLALLVYGSVLIFLAFDRNSHSVSDTVRPFIITVGPVWLIALAGARTWLHGASRT